MAASNSYDPVMHGVFFHSSGQQLWFGNPLGLRIVGSLVGLVADGGYAAVVRG